VLGAQASPPARVARNQVGYLNDLAYRTFVNLIRVARGQAGRLRSQHRGLIIFTASAVWGIFAFAQSREAQ
jgi:hypothetical protein